MLIAGLITLVLGGLLYYFWLPPMNIQSVSCWIFWLALLFVFVLIVLLEDSSKGAGRIEKVHQWLILGWCLVFALFAVFMVGSTKLFQARAYSEILTVRDGNIENIPSVEGKDSIALMDTASAEKLGNREIGSLSEVVSQYDVSAYTQIDYQGMPVKVSPLRYVGFFKWMSNKSVGVPGYVVVNPVSMDADYRAMKAGMKYIPSAYFSQDLERHMRFHYPGTMFGNLHFEIDEEGNPWYVASTYEHQAGLFGGTQVNGAILVNPVDGTMEKMTVEKVPEWVDVVFSGDLICEQYNNNAQLHKGFWNSIFGQVGCRKVTEFVSDDEDESSYSDYGYIAKDGDIWIYTGVTSLNNDSSNIGFILSNERTEETIFVAGAGADEFSAMASAQGEVQEKGYVASFPSLILINNKPTYIMVLKDAGGLVKMYAAVNVEQYNMVATAATQEACLDKYEALLSGKISQADAVNDTTVITEDTADYVSKTIIVKKLQTMDENGNTYLYIVDSENHIYRARYADVLDMLLVETGDEIVIETDGTNYRYQK